MESPHFLKRVAPCLIDVLCYLFNLRIEHAVLPYQWKQAIVIPIHKKGDRDSPRNYRPISPTCVMCRLFESIMSEKLLNHLLSNDIFTSRQHGFIPGKSTCTQLLSVLNKWHYSFDNNVDIDVIYFTDFANAVDTVSHTKLIAVLHSYGVSNEQ